MKRLLQISTVPQTLGLFISPLAHHFRELGWQVDAMSAGIHDNAMCREAFDNLYEARWSRNPADPKNLLAGARCVRALVKKNNYDIVHMHTPVASFVTRYALRQMRAQGVAPALVYTAHGFHFHPNGNPLSNSVFLGLEKLAGHWTDYLVVMNREDHKAAINYGIMAEERVRYMPGIGVDTQFYNPRRVRAERSTAIRDELGIEHKAPIFLMIAEFKAGKRHRDMLRAMAKLNRPDVQLICAGDGMLFEKTRALARELGIAAQVHFVGQRQDIAELIGASFITVLPSEREGLPRCILESLSMGVPVIGADIRGVRELLSEQCGLLFDVGDTTALAGQMRWCLDNPQAVRAMGKSARARMVAQFDARKILAMHEALYAQALGQERQKRAGQQPFPLQEQRSW
ncbi:MAG: glycosyltransferase [Bradymonadaceae bacterium]|nr:glycosyltransferase [Lujinxingiaceae bacterium]